MRHGCRTIARVCLALAVVFGVMLPAVAASARSPLATDGRARLNPTDPICELPGGLREERCTGGPEDDTARATGPSTSALVADAVEQQQRHLNRLFDGYGIEELLVDGDSGPVTEQRLCAFRVAVGLPPSTADMQPRSEEEAILFATAELPPLSGPATEPARWILIDQTCQIMFAGTAGGQVRFVFPTSTGQAAFPTRLQDRTPAYRFNPANHNGGWHNSTTYPAAVDNPLNGNMYRPLYFDGGQAIHGANSVPRSPASHGCARLRTWHQDELLGWLGLGDSGPTNDRSRIGVAVTVRGHWQG
jgi:lipoprotein-anchoring transpeptidase ErfK/SrfK